MPFDMYNLTPLSLLHRARIGVFQAAFRAAKERMPTTIRSTAARADSQSDAVINEGGAEPNRSEKALI